MQFGDTITLKVTPGLVIRIGSKTEEFINTLLEKGEVDLERECLAFSQKILGLLGEEKKSEVESAVCRSVPESPVVL